MKLLRFAPLFLIFFAGGFFSLRFFSESPCDTTLYYSIGEFDERFDVSQAEALDTLEHAADSWEEVLGKDFFIYRDDAPFKVNFIFGEEQEKIQVAQKLLDGLDSIQKNIDKNELEYEKVKKLFTKTSQDYKEKLALYEKDVSYWNTKGGAPQDEYQELLERKSKLDAFFRRVQSIQKKLNRLVEKNNQTIHAYNKKIEDYNKLFSQERDFELGDTNNLNQINIHSFKDEEELYTILVHEFGHVLGLDHLPQEDAVMYYLLNEKNKKGKLSPADKDALRKRCHLK